MAVPTLGWVARNDDDATCSFPDGAGGCLPASRGRRLRRTRSATADPETANVPSTPESVADWVARPGRRRVRPRVSSPWTTSPSSGASRTTTSTRRARRTRRSSTSTSTYAAAIREVAPDEPARRTGDVLLVRLLGHRPGTGRRIGRGLPRVVPRARSRRHDDEYGQRTLDVVDVHYYPQSDVFNDETDAETTPGGCAAPARCGTRRTPTSHGSASRSGSSLG